MAAPRIDAADIGNHKFGFRHLDMVLHMLWVWDLLTDAGSISESRDKLWYCGPRLAGFHQDLGIQATL